jgi:predicted LPLAT superfamily acyltransferase
MSNVSRGKYGLFIGLAVLAGVLAYYVLTAPDRRSAGQKISDAVHELPEGTDKAARQLESRTPGEKLGDAAEDAGDDLKKATNQQ